MTSTPSPDSEQQAVLLMPWLTNKSLPPTEAARLTSSLGQSPDLAEEARLNQMIAKSVNEWAQASPEPASDILGRVTSRIRRADAAVEQEREPAGLDRFLSRISAEFRRFYAGIALGALAGATAASLLLLLVFNGTELRQNDYLPASGPGSATGGKHLLLVTFPADQSIKETADVLRSAGAEIVKGPLPSNLFVVRLNTATDEEFEAAKERLSQNPHSVQVLGPFE